MAVPFTITGIPSVDAAFAALPVKAQKKLIRKAARPIAKDVLASARDYAPVQFGDLEDSLRVRAMKRSRKNKDVVGVRVVTSEHDSLFAGDQFYGAFQELGTNQMESNEFLRPSYEENETPGIAKFKVAMGELVKEARP